MNTLLITTTASVIRIVDENNHTMVFGKGDLHYKIISNMLYFYVTSTGEEIYTITLPVNINSVVYTDKDTVLNQLDSFFKIGGGVGDGSVDLSNYYTKSQVDLLLSDIEVDPTTLYIIGALPSTGQEGKIYVEPIDDNTARSYVWKDNNWVLIGSFQPLTDMTDYYRKEEINTILSDYYTKAEISNLLSNKLNISNNPNIVYTTDSTGQQIVTNYSTQATANTIPLRDENGNISAPSNVDVTTDNYIGAKQVVDMIPSNGIGVYDVTGNIDPTSADGTPICRIEIDNLLFTIVKNGNYGSLRVQGTTTDNIMINVSIRQFYDSAGVEPRSAKWTINNTVHYQFDDNVGYGGKTNAAGEIQIISTGKQYVLYASGASTTNSTTSADKYSLSVMPLTSVFVKGNATITKNDLPSDIVYFENVDPIPTQNSANLVASGGVWQMIQDVVQYQLPIKFPYTNTNIFTMPKSVVDIAEIRLYAPNNSYNFLQEDEYSFSGTDVTINVTLTEGSAVKIFWFAR